MSTLIRHDGTGDSIGPPPWRMLSDKCASTKSDPAVAAYVARVEQLEATIADLKRAHEAALTRAFEEGGEEARAAFARDEAKALETLRLRMSDARTAFEARIDRLDELAPLMCETVLENLFGDTLDQSDLIRLAIRRQTSLLRKESIVAIVVSGADFSDASALAELEANCPGLTVRIDAALARGDCRIELRLGQIELSLGSYRQEITARLRELAVGP